MESNRNNRNKVNIKLNIINYVAFIVIRLVESPTPNDINNFRAISVIIPGSAFIFAFTFVMTSAVDALLIFFSLALLLVYGMITGDRRILKVFGGFTMTTLLNTSYAMMIGGYFGEGQNSSAVLMTAADPVLIIFSIVNVALLGYLGYLIYSICIKEDVKGVVVIEGNYFKYAWEKIKACGLAIAHFCTVTVPALFRKKAETEGAEVESDK